MAKICANCNYTGQFHTYELKNQAEWTIEPPQILYYCPGEQCHLVYTRSEYDALDEVQVDG